MLHAVGRELDVEAFLFPGVEILALDFGLRWKDGAPQTDSFPSELLWRAGALDITLQVSRFAIAPRES